MADIPSSRATNIGIPPDPHSIELPSVAWEITWKPSVAGQQAYEILKDKGAADQLANFLEQKGEQEVDIHSLVRRNKVYTMFRRIRAPLTELTDRLAEYESVKWTPEFNDLLVRLKANLYDDDRVVAVNFRLGFPKIFVFLQSMQSRLRALEAEIAVPVGGAEMEVKEVRDIKWQSRVWVRDDVHLERVSAASEQLRKQFEKTSEQELKLVAAERRIVELLEENLRKDVEAEATEEYILKLLEIYNDNVGRYKVEYSATRESFPTLLDTVMQVALKERNISRDSHALASRESKEGLKIVQALTIRLDEFLTTFQQAEDRAHSERLSASGTLDEIAVKSDQIIHAVLQNESLIRRWMNRFRSLLIRLGVSTDEVLTQEEIEAPLPSTTTTTTNGQPR